MARLGVLETLNPELLRPAPDAVQGGRWHAPTVKRSFGPTVDIHEDGAVFICGLLATWFCDLRQRDAGMAYVLPRLRPAAPPPDRDPGRLDRRAPSARRAA